MPARLGYKEAEAQRGEDLGNWYRIGESGPGGSCPGAAAEQGGGIG